MNYIVFCVTVWIVCVCVCMCLWALLLGIKLLMDRLNSVTVSRTSTLTRH